MDNRISHAVRFIETNYSRSISIEDLTQCAKLSRSRLDTLFKIETGVSPVKYLKQARIRRAAQLLASDDPLTIKEVMASVGLSDKSHFARDFKQVLGLTPSEYKRDTARREASVMVEPQAELHRQFGQPIGNLANSFL